MQDNDMPIGLPFEESWPFFLFHHECITIFSDGTPPSLALHRIHFCLKAYLGPWSLDLLVVGAEEWSKNVGHE